MEGVKDGGDGGWRRRGELEEEDKFWVRMWR